MRVVVAPSNDEQVFQAPTDENFVVVEEAQVACAPSETSEASQTKWVGLAYIVVDVGLL